jgi:selenocysteine lyase/cysteine desulfurase
VERAEAARGAFARLVGADPDEIAVTTSVSQAVSGLVSALPLERGRDRIVISEFEFPTVGQIAHAQELRGAEVVHVHPETDGRIPLERFAEAIDERTALVCCTAISYRTGYRLDVAEVARIAHERGALCLADSYQAAGAVPLDVRSLGVDLLTAGTVKYLLASAGLAFMFVRRDLHERLLPTQTGWFADEDIFQMDISDYSPAGNARRFDAGTPPVPNIYAGIAGMGVVEEAGVAAIEAHVRGLVDRLLSGLDELGATVATPRGEHELGPLVCIASTDPDALVRALRARTIVTSARDANVRVSLHLYNVEDDVGRILEALAAERHLLA